MTLITRRRLTVGLSGLLAASSLAARAQPRQRMRRIGVLMGLAADDPESQSRIGAFLQGLQELGWSLGRNLQIDYRWSPGDTAGYRRFAAELVALAPDVILAHGGSIATALRQATRTIPIVFASVTDAVGAGLIHSLSQ